MSSSNLKRKTVIWAILSQAYLMIGILLIVWAFTSGRLSLFAFRIALPALIASCVGWLLFLRSRFRAQYRDLPLNSQLEIDRRTQRSLRRQAFWIKVWWCWLPFAMILAQLDARKEGLWAQLMTGSIGIVFFAYSLYWRRAIFKSLKLLDEKLVQSPTGE